MKQDLYIVSFLRIRTKFCGRVEWGPTFLAMWTRRGKILGPGRCLQCLKCSSVYVAGLEASDFKCYLGPSTRIEILTSADRMASSPFP